MTAALIVQEERGENDRDRVSSVIRLAIELDATLAVQVTTKKPGERSDVARARMVKEVLVAQRAWPKNGEPDLIDVVWALGVIKSLIDVAVIQFDIDEGADSDDFRPASTRLSYLSKFQGQQTSVTRAIRERLEELVRIRELVRGDR